MTLNSPEKYVSNGFNNHFYIYKRVLADLHETKHLNTKKGLKKYKKLVLEIIDNAHSDNEQ